MARAKREIDKEEIEEIILLKLEELGGRKSKLTANNVAKFSKEIANNEKYKRKNGKLFNYYGYDIWAGRYKGQDARKTAVKKGDCEADLRHCLH